MPVPKVRKKAQLRSPPELLAAVEAQRAGRLADAEALYRAVLKENPAHWQALHQLGTIHLARGQLPEALQCIGAAMKANAGSAEVTSNYGVVLRRLKRDDEAIEYFNRALILKPGYVPALLTRGASLHRLGRRAEALASIDRAISIQPDNAKAHFNRATILHELGRFEEAFKAYVRAAELEPENADIHWNESLCRLVYGDYAEGWKKYEWRKKRPSYDDRKFPIPLWLGEESVAGKTILIHAEQGFGDTLQCVRYVPLLAEMGARVVLEVQPALKSLLTSLKDVTTLIARGEEIPPCDLHCPIMSLPLAFKTELRTIPANVPYLSAPAERIAKWRAFIPKEKFTIAFACSGSPGNEENDIRSVPLENFAPLFADRDVQWILVQRDLLPRDAEFLKLHPEVMQLGSELSDFADTAAVILQADLVISVCTSLAHVAGALGLPFWMLSKHSPDFRWLLDREDSPWYPTARIFRQPDFGDWESVIETVGRALGPLKQPRAAR